MIRIGVGFVALAAAAALWAGCAEDDPETDGPGGSGGGGVGGTGGGGGVCPEPLAEDVSGCEPLPTDYRPRDDGSANDAWPACISDDGTYHRIEESVSTIARVEAFEEIADLLWRGAEPPSAQDFLDARVIYAADQGLDSRVQRREDLHYPPPASGACTEPGVPEANPERCVGPARILPVLNDAFAAGARGEAPRVNAARIEAALLWFFAVSVHKEANTCAQVPKDCDSAWAYYAGGTPRESPIGLAARVDALAPETHDRAYDGALAVRCWRNLDHETGEAQDPAMQARAVEQLDRAVIRGVARIARARFRALACHESAAAEADLAFLETLAPFLDRAARAAQPVAADVLAAEAAKATPAEVDVAAAVGAIDALFPCP